MAAPFGFFDLTSRGLAWFDETSVVEGWFDSTLIAAAVTGAAYRTSVSNGTTHPTSPTATITPAVGDLFLVYCSVSDTDTTPTCADNNGGTYTRVDTALYNASLDSLFVFVRDQLLANTTSTVVTITTTGTSINAMTSVVAISGMTRVGGAAVRSKGNQANQAGGGTPAPALNQAALTANVTIGAVGAAQAAPVVVQPTGWTERQDVSQSFGAGSNVGLEVVTRDSGFTGTTVTWGGTVTQAFASHILELDGSLALTLTQQDPVYPHAIVRPAFAARHQLAVTSISPQPLRPPTVDPVYPVAFEMHRRLLERRWQQRFVGDFPQEIFTTPWARSNCLVWHDTDTGVTTSGGLVTDWGDRGPSGDTNRKLTQATSGQRPAYKADDWDFNYHGSITSDGVDDNLASVGDWSGAPIAQPTTHWFVGRIEATPTSGNYYFDGPSSATSRQALFDIVVPQVYAGAQFASGVAMPIGKLCIVCVVYNGASSAIYINDMTTPAGTGDASTQGISGETLFARYTHGAGECIAVRMVAKGAFSSSDSSSVRNSMYSYLSTKYTPTDFIQAAPTSVQRPFYRPQDAYSTLPWQPILSTPLPDTNAPALHAQPRARQGLLGGVTSIQPLPERTTPAFDVEYADTVRRPLVPSASQLTVTQIEPLLLTTKEKWSASYPDAVDRAKSHASRQQASLTIAPQPERTIQPADAEFPDLVRRPNVLAAHQWAVAVQAPQPENTNQHDWSSSFADRADRPAFATAQQFATMWPPFQFSAAVTPVELVRYPDAIARAIPAQQRALADLAPATERTSTLWSVYFPDRVELPVFTPGQQLAATQISPQPERTLPLVDVRFADRVERPWFEARQQLVVTEVQPAPERTIPIAATIYPDRTVRPAFASAQQLAATTIAPQPEDRVSLDWQGVYTDRATRAWMPASVRPTFTMAPQPEERVQLDWAPSFPERALRATYPTTDQSAFTSSQQPEERLQHDWSTSHPDRVVRPTYATAEHPFAFFAPQPERPVPAASSAFPDRVDRPAYSPTQQLAATSLSPSPERNAPMWSVTFPDGVVRPAMPAAAQLAVTQIAPSPLITKEMWSTTYPDAATRPSVPAVQQGPSFAMWPVPITAAALTQQNTGWSVYPDSVTRPTFAAVQQRATLPIDPAPLLTKELWTAIFPARVDRPSFPTTAQLPATSIAPAPERTTAIASTTYPDRVERPGVRAERQLAATSEPPAPERTLQLADVTFPERVWRPTTRAADQPFFSPATAPERTVPATDTAYPHRVTRPFLAISQHLAIASAPTFPEETRQLDWQPHYPDRATRVLGHASQQRAFTSVTQPITIVVPQLAATYYPDWLQRLVAQQPSYWCPPLAATTVPISVPIGARTTLVTVKLSSTTETVPARIALSTVKNSTVIETVPKRTVGKLPPNDSGDPR